MSFRFDGFTRIRAALELSEKKVTLTDAISGGAVPFFRGARLRFEFGLFYKGEIADASLITAARLRILSDSDPDSALAMDKTIGPAEMNTGIDIDDWNGGESADAHLRFEFTATEAAEGAFTGTLDDGDVPHWFLLTSGVNEDFLGAGTVISFDGGYNPAAGSPPAVGTGATVDQINAILQAALSNVVKYTGNPAAATIELTAPTTGKKVKLGCDDEGNFITDTQAEN